MNMNFDLNKLIRNVSKVKLSGGVFGKTCQVIIIIALCFVAIAFIAKNLWISIAAMVFIFIIAFVFLWKLLSFANKNPQAAILDGAEFLVHQQIEYAAKGIPNLSTTPNKVTIGAPISMTEVEKKELDNPDRTETQEKEVPNA
ncbi:hypothetical protein ECE50_021015 [Chitinophaga sp. Mgbs1]|uniref:Uncharacterized protein n=1 Tax=Chitinophaga solisilvae TaxID=1233460 RepID=A0A3S1CWI1_9BACT|nr:hypothetical protein [Chitinophaga solisilvae]